MFEWINPSFTQAIGVNVGIVIFATLLGLLIGGSALTGIRSHHEKVQVVGCLTFLIAFILGGGILLFSVAFNGYSMWLMYQDKFWEQGFMSWVLFIVYALALLGILNNNKSN